MHLAERELDPNLSIDLEYAGSGGEHVVFRVKQKEGREGEYRPLVVKANTYYLRRGLIRHAVNDWRIAPFATADDARIRKLAESMKDEDEDRVLMEDEIEQEQEFFEMVKKYFPLESILRARTVIRDVPITPAIAREIMDVAKLTKLSPKETVKVPTIVRYQKEIPTEAEIESDPVARSFGFRYAERYNIPLGDYYRLNQMCAGRAEFDRDLFINFLHKGFADILREARTDERLREVISELVGRIIKFTNETNEMMDLAGKGNLRVYKNAEGEWKYLLVDVWAGMDWADANQLARSKINRDTRLGGYASSNLLNATNYARLMNGLAIMFGVRERLELFPTSSIIDQKFSGSLLYLLRKQNDWPDKEVSLRSSAPEEGGTLKLKD